MNEFNFENFWYGDVFCPDEEELYWQIIHNIEEYGPYEDFDPYKMTAEELAGHFSFDFYEGKKVPVPKIDRERLHENTFDDYLSNTEDEFDYEFSDHVNKLLDQIDAAFEKEAPELYDRGKEIDDKIAYEMLLPMFQEWKAKQEEPQ